jgi:hypothetical protein
VNGLFLTGLAAGGGGGAAIAAGGVAGGGCSTLVARRRWRRRDRLAGEAAARRRGRRSACTEKRQGVTLSQILSDLFFAGGGHPRLTKQQRWGMWTFGWHKSSEPRARLILSDHETRLKQMESLPGCG